MSPPKKSDGFIRISDDKAVTPPATELAHRPTWRCRGTHTEATSLGRHCREPLYRGATGFSEFTPFTLSSAHGAMQRNSPPVRSEPRTRDDHLLKAWASWALPPWNKLLLLLIQCLRM